MTRRVLASMVEGGILIILLVLACYVSMGRILVANIDTFRDDIETAMSDALNVPVSIEGMRGDWTYLDPEIFIERLTIGDPSLPAIDIEGMSARLDAVGSFRERGIVVREIDVDGLSLSVRQDMDGGWFVEGLPRTGAGFNPDPLISSIKYLRLVDVTGVDVEVKARKKHYHLTNQEELPLLLMAEGQEKLLTMPLVFQQSGKGGRAFQLLGRYSGDPREPENFEANLYLKLPEIELTDLLSLPDSKISLREITAEGEFWLDWRGGGFELTALPTIHTVTFRNEDRNVTAIKNANARLVVRGDPEGHVTAHVAELAGEVGSRPWALADINVASRGRDVAVSVPQLSIDAAARAALEIGGALGLVDEKGLNAIRRVEPGGTLRHVLYSHAAKDGAFKLTASVDDAHVESMGGSPAISRLDGFVSIEPGKGYIDIHNDAFTLHFANIFAEPWPFDSARARIHYSAIPGYLQVRSGLIEVTNGPVTANGRFHANIPSDKLNRTWGLEVGIVNGDLVDANRYLPGTLSDDLITWLDSSLLGGHATSAGLLFHGALDKEAPRISKVYELYFDVEDAVLDYDPAWPEIDRLDAMVYIGNWGVESTNATGRVYSTDITRGGFSIPFTFGEQPDSIFVNADLAGPVENGVRVLAETPIADVTDNMASSWTGTGDFKGRLGLDIPIGPRAGEPVGVDVTAHFGGGDSIYMGGFDLDVADLVGTITYSDDHGLGAEELEANLFGRPVTASIQTGVENGGGATAIDVEGMVDISDIYAWSDQSLLAKAKGTAAYQAQVHIPFGTRKSESSYVKVTSNLDGVSVDLPPPMRKAEVGTSVPLDYKQSFLEDGFRIDLAFGEETRASLRTRGGLVTGGRVHFGKEPMGAVTYGDVRVTGALAFADYDEWQRLTEFLDKRSEVSIESEVANSLESVDLDIKQLDAFGLSIANAATYITRETGLWNVRLQSRTVSGLIKVPDRDGAPINVSLDHLRLPGDEREEGEEDGEGEEGDEELLVDPMKDVDPREMVAVDFRVEDFFIGDEDYGQWTFQMRPRETGVVFEKLSAEVKGLSIPNTSQVTWDFSESAGHTSRFKGPVHVSDLAHALTQWGFASSIEGEGFAFDTELSWPGSPAMVDVDTSSGVVHLRQGKGRFVQAESGTGALRLLGIFDFASLARRFQFDFSDVVNTGFTFTEIKGSTRFNKGIVTIVDPIVIVGAGSTFKVGGSLDLQDNSLDNDMIVTLPLSRNLPWYAAYSAIATGPIAGAGVWLVQKIFENQIDAMSSAKYKISGTVDKPVIEFVSIFSDSVREVPVDSDSAGEEGNEPTPAAAPASSASGTTGE